MKKLVSLLLLWACSLLFGATALAATPQPPGTAYQQRYFTTIAAASCLGVYLPQSSTEFDYLRSYGWQIVPQVEKSDKVEANFAIAHNYFKDIGKDVYLVTFRGSASKGDWRLNLKTERVNFGGSTPEEMAQLAGQPLVDGGPAVHAGFNSYVDAVLRSQVVDARGNLQGVFAKVQQNPNTHLVLTGHSLGGAVATLLGERLVSLGLPADRFTIVTFGAPAVGNAAFVERYGEAVDLLRITNTADPVPGSLQTFFGGYKQFGRQEKYSLSPKVSSLQHAMAMYFDYSVSEFYKERDHQISLGRLQPAPRARTTGGRPVVALWLNTSESLSKLAYVTDIKRFVTDEYRRLLPSYVVMGRNLPKDDYTTNDIIKLSREAGADYVLVCGIDGSQPQQETYWYLTLEQALFDKSGRMLTMGSFGRKVAPAVGNIQAAGENFWQARDDLYAQLPFINMQHVPTMGQM